MTDLAASWFTSEQFMPHGHCFMWTPAVLWMHVIADILISMAYFTIPFVLLYITRRRKDVPLDWLVLCFGLFIVACGLTHVMDIWNVWHTNYWLEGAIKVLTAAASVPKSIDTPCTVTSRRLHTYSVRPSASGMVALGGIVKPVSDWPGWLNRCASTLIAPQVTGIE